MHSQKGHAGKEAKGGCACVTLKTQKILFLGKQLGRKYGRETSAFQGGDAYTKEWNEG